MIDAKTVVDREVMALSDQEATQLRADAQVDSLKSQLAVLTDLFVADNTRALASLQAKLDESSQALVKTSARVGYTRLVAPVDGTIQDVSLTTPGQVVSSGQQLMTIVPDAALLEVEAMVMNKDIGFIEVGQHAVIKLDAFPFSRYGALEGTVVRVSHDAVRNPGSSDAGFSARASNSAASIATTGVAPVQDLVFPVTVELQKLAIEADGKDIPLSSGMTAVVEVRTGQRRVLEYFMSPLAALKSIGHER